MRHLDAQLRGTRKKVAAAVKVSGTTLTQVSGAGPVIADTIIGDIADVSASPAALTSPPTTASPLSRCPPGTGQSAGSRCAATAATATPSTWPRSPRSGTGTAKAARILRA
jgi:hypothetical protein